MGKKMVDGRVMVLATYLVYACLAAAALKGTFGNEGIATMWPAGGFAVATLASVRRRDLPLHAVAVFGASLSANLAFGNSTATAATFSIANLVETLTAVALLSRCPFGGPSFIDVRQVIGFLFAATVASLTSASIASGVEGWSDSMFSLSWFTTDLLGIVLVAPPTFLFIQWGLSSDRPRISPRFCMSVAMVLLANLLAFGQSAVPLLFIPAVVLMAGAYLAGPGGATSGVLLTALIGSVAVNEGLGPFNIIDATSEARIFFLQGYLVVLLASALPMAALRATATRLTAALAERTRLLVMAERVAGVGHWHLDLEDGRLIWSDEIFRIHGIPVGDTPDLAFALAAYHEDDRGDLTAKLDGAIRNRASFRHRARIVGADGLVRHVLVKGEAMVLDGMPKALFGIVQDITRQVEDEALVEAARHAAEAAAAEAIILAETDALTGIPNRRRVLADLDGMHDRAAAGMAMGVAIFDIDRFKAINDMYGHAVGDAVLRQVSQSARTVLRLGDRIGRLGGEEFIVLLPGADWTTAMRVAEMIRRRIECEVGDVGIPKVTASVGVAVAIAGEDVASLLRRADAALYAAKSGGRNAIRIAS